MPQVISKNSSVPTELPKQSDCSHNKCILLSILLLIIGAAAGFYLGGTISSSDQSVQNPDKSAVKKGSYEDGYQTALDFARKKVEEKGMFFPAGKMLGIQSATVKSVSGKNIVVEFDASLLDFFAEGKLTKTVTVPDNVSIQQNVPKPVEDYQKEEDAFREKISEMNAKIAAGDTSEIANVQPPTPYTIKKLGIKDLKPGDVISVTTSADISKSDTFEAISVILAYIPEDMKNLNENMGNINLDRTTPTLTPDSFNPPAPEAPNADVIPTPPTSPTTDTGLNEEAVPPTEKPADTAGVSVPPAN